VKKKGLLVAALVVAALPLLFLGAYRIAAKKLLSGPMLRAEINKKPEEIFIDWDWAVSTWPGFVRVGNLRIRGSDQNVQWIVTIPETTVSYEVGALLRRTFRVTALRPTSIQFRLRQKLPADQATPDRLKNLPEIPGFADPPLRDPDAKVEPPDPNPWKFEVLDVATDAFDDIWVDAVRHRGNAALRGRFRLKPGHRAQIGPASVVFSGGPLTVGPTPFLTETHGKLEATFADWDVQELLGDKVWRVVTAKVELSGPTEGVDFLAGALDLGRGVRFSGGPGRFGLDGSIEKGVTSGSVALTAKHGKYARPGLALVGSAEAKLKFSDWQLDGGAPQIGGSSVKFTDVFVSGAPKGTPDWWGAFEIPTGRLKNGLSGKVALQCKDGRPLLAFLGESLPKWTQGLIKLEGLKATTEVVFSEPRTAVRNLHAEGGDFRIEGEYDRRGEHSNGAFLLESGILIVGVELDDGKAAVRPLLARQWFEKARGEVAAETKAEASAGSRAPGNPGAESPTPR
jgi:hypothetical protein